MIPPLDGEKYRSILPDDEFWYYIIKRCSIRRHGVESFQVVSYEVVKISKCMFRGIQLAGIHISVAGFVGSRYACRGNRPDTFPYNLAVHCYMTVFCP
jgi:hypothetical protein